MSAISIVLGERYFKKDPQSSELGRKIVTEGALLMDELGYDDFTFKKLAERIHSTEASIYRYFKNKLKLLVYLSTYYWSWLEYMIDFETHHISDPKEKLKLIIRMVAHDYQFPKEVEMPGLDIVVVRRIVDLESDKTYLTKRVDEINSKGLFKGYKSLCHRIALVIMDFNSEFKYPHAIASMMLESSHQQAFFALHLPSLTEVHTANGQSVEAQVAQFLEHIILKSVS